MFIGLSQLFADCRLGHSGRKRRQKTGNAAKIPGQNPGAKLAGLLPCAGGG